MSLISRRTMIGAVGASFALPWSRLAAAFGDDGAIVSRIALEAERIIAGVQINGQGPYFFMIDSGGVVSLIREELAKQLSLPVAGSNRLNGVGGSGDYKVYRAKDFVIGGVIRQTNVVLAATPGFGFGRDLQGAIAAGSITTFDSVLDFDRGEWRVYPKGLAARPGYEQIPSDITLINTRYGSAHMFADAVLDGRTYRFLVDTGAPRQISLRKSAAVRSGLLEGRPYVPTRASGLGGAAKIGRTVRASELQIGSQRFAAPLVLLSADDPHSGDLGDGVIGLPILRQLNLSTDVSKSRLWIQRNRQPAPPERYGMSGLWLDDEKGRVIVGDVGRGSPAEAAGIKVGDEIADLAIGMAVRRLGGRPGAVVPLTIVRSGTRQSVSLTLKPYL